MCVAHAVQISKKSRTEIERTPLDHGNKIVMVHSLIVLYPYICSSQLNLASRLVDRLAGLGPLTRLVVTLLPASQEYTLGLATRQHSPHTHTSHTAFNLS